jgi:hypothetical protein
MLEKKQQIGFEYFPGTNSFSVHKDSLILEDGIEVGKSRHTMAFTCDMIDEMKKYLGDEKHPLIAYCDSIWTQDVIDAFKKQQEAVEQGA